MGVSENSGTQQPWGFLRKLTILGCFGGKPTILGNPHMVVTFGEQLLLDTFQFVPQNFPLNFNEALLLSNSVTSVPPKCPWIPSPETPLRGSGYLVSG